MSDKKITPEKLQQAVDHFKSKPFRIKYLKIQIDSLERSLKPHPLIENLPLFERPFGPSDGSGNWADYLRRHRQLQEARKELALLEAQEQS